MSAAKACTTEYDPYCGVNGKTYSNMCHMRGSGVQIKHRGECETPPCICNYIVEPTPVCGKDGKTYSGICELECAKVELAYNGKCMPKFPWPKDPAQPIPQDDTVKLLPEAETEQPAFCNLNYLPVCGKDGKTYANECEMKVANVDLKHRGDCDKGHQNGTVDIPYFKKPDKIVACPLTLLQVCGKDGKTYDNECLLKAARVQLDYEGECKNIPQGGVEILPEVPQVKLPVACPLTLLQVCGKDGKTYDNECLLKAARVQLDYEGECKNIPQGGVEILPEVPQVKLPVACPLTLLPVCGKDGKTYDNECLLKAAKVELDYEGECGKSQQGGVVVIPVIPQPEQPVACPLNYLPVCGKDGKTYPNECQLRAAKVELDYEGECGKSQQGGVVVIPVVPEPQQPSMCPMIWVPVCGKDGKTYSNSCELGVAKVELDYDGECKKDQQGGVVVVPVEPGFEQPIACPLNYLPVCGKDGKTYPNECQLRAAKIEFGYEGECLKPQESGIVILPDQPRPIYCLEIWKPVCGKDGKTYGNECELKRAGVALDHEGECASNNCGCPLDGKPVCGKDGKDYKNLCFMKCAGVEIDHINICSEGCYCPQYISWVCGKDGNSYANPCYAACKAVEVEREGQCGMPCGCSKEYNPVCGNDDKDYPNPCVLKCAGTTIKHRNKCSEGCVCPMNYDPVCGKDNTTYPNACAAGCALVEVARNGECRKPCPCPKIYRPVCGSDNKTYANDCLLKCQDGVTVQYKGPCGTIGSSLDE